MAQKKRQITKKNKQITSKKNEKIKKNKIRTDKYYNIEKPPHGVRIHNEKEKCVCYDCGNMKDTNNVYWTNEWDIMENNQPKLVSQINYKNAKYFLKIQKFFKNRLISTRGQITPQLQEYIKRALNMDDSLLSIDD